MISVVIATFNSSRWLEAQLASVLNQSVAADEIIITDDGSVDDTLRLARRLTAGTGCRVEILEGRVGGAIANFERGLRRASGDILVLCDHDDVWRDDKLAVVADWFSRETQGALFFSNASIIDESGEDSGATLWDSYSFTEADLRRWNQGDEWVILARQPVLTGATAAFHARVLPALFPVPPLTWHDEWLALIAPLFGKTFCLDEPLISYRVHGDNAVGIPRTSLVERVRGMVDGVPPSTQELLRWRALERLLASHEDVRNVELVDDKIRFLESRLTLSKHRLGRVPAVAKLWRHGGYAHFADGGRTAISDLVKRWATPPGS